MAKASAIPEYQYEYSKISTKTPVKRKRRRSMRGLIAACLAAIMSLAAAGLMVKGLFVRIELAEQSDKIIAAKQELSRIEEENRRLRIEYETKIDLDEIEEYAKNILGMQRAGESRTEIIDTDTQDKAIVIERNLCCLNNGRLKTDFSGGSSLSHRYRLRNSEKNVYRV